MGPLYNEQISQDLQSIDSILESIFGIGSLSVAGITAFLTGAGLFITIITAVVGFLGSIAYYLLQSIPLFIMARKAGHPHPWMAFFPYANDFLTFSLPAREFNLLNIIKTKRRDVMALIYIILIICGTTIVLPLIVTVTAAIPVIGPIFSSFGGIILLVVINLFKWRMYYDLLMTFGQKNNALWVSIISLFVPWLFMIFTIFSCKNPPEYGIGNYRASHNIK